MSLFCALTHKLSNGQCSFFNSFPSPSTSRASILQLEGEILNINSRDLHQQPGLKAFDES